MFSHLSLTHSLDRVCTHSLAVWKWFDDPGAWRRDSPDEIMIINHSTNSNSGRSVSAQGHGPHLYLRDLLHETPHGTWNYGPSLHKNIAKKTQRIDIRDHVWSKSSVYRSLQSPIPFTIAQHSSWIAVKGIPILLTDTSKRHGRFIQYALHIPCAFEQPASSPIVYPSSAGTLPPCPSFQSVTYKYLTTQRVTCSREQPIICHIWINSNW